LVEPLSQDPSLSELEQLVAQCLYADRQVLLRLLSTVKRRLERKQEADKSMQRLQAGVRESLAIRQSREQVEVKYNYPDELPISQKRDDIKQMLEKHQVVIVAGETGSGKTTQIPKICMELGRGILGRIGHTQPRRIAARTVATRIAEEIQCELGTVIGYQVRFHGQVKPSTRVKLMTDGILLAEIQTDPDLLQYDTIIIDEAHERSLNIDFLLGYLQQLITRRPQLKLIITSATIATEKFSKHFNGAPVLEVSGRSYPVEVLYRPLYSDNSDEETVQLQQAIVDAVDELSSIDRGDILIFLSTEREIRDTAESLRKHHPGHTEVLPLFSRLSVSEQNKIFQPHKKRRIVLATNVAETSLTVPGISFVIDPGYARISRYSYRSKVQRLPIEKVSQASANQRMGRCGRISAGVCMRLYDEEDFGLRPQFTEPEIRRTNLASVILNMKVLGLADIEEFPFMEPPDQRYINDGYRLLFELGAVDELRKLTDTGKQMARLPLDPRLSRMVLHAREENCLQEILVIVCALESQDPRERPLDAQQKADQSHKEFADDQSDFASLLKIWTFYHEQSRHLSKNKLRQLCAQRFLSYRRMLEWHDLHKQLSHQVREMGMSVNSTTASIEAIHRALLSGLVSHVGFNDGDSEYQGSHGKKFMIFPGSGLFKKKPKWLMAAEIVETSRLYARSVAAIQPEWIEQVAGHLIKRSYSEPYWQARRGQVAAMEKLTLYGLTLISNRRVNYGPIDPVLARKIFIRSALVTGDFKTRFSFMKENLKIIEQVQVLEDKSRRRDIVVDEQVLYDFYDQRIPETIYNQAAFDKWWRKIERKTPALLNMSPEEILRDDAETVSDQAYPDHILIDQIPLKLKYHFSPGQEDDGVSVLVPLAMLNQLRESDFEWLVPGLIYDKIVALLKALPKSIRRNFVPVPDYARACLEVIAPGPELLHEQLSRQLKRMTGIDVSLSAWQPQRIADHLRMNYRVLGKNNKSVAQGRDLNALKQQLKDRAEASFAAQANAIVDNKDSALEKEIDCWNFGDLAESTEMNHAGITMKAYPALIEHQGKFTLAQLDQPQKAEASSCRAQALLFKRMYKKDIDYLSKNIPDSDKICLYHAPLGQCEALKQDIVYVVIFRALQLDQGMMRSESEFTQRSLQAKKSLVNTMNETAAVLLDILSHYHELNKYLRGNLNPGMLKSLSDIKSQLEHLLHRGFLLQTPWQRLAHMPRYLKAMIVRLDKLKGNLQRDLRLMGEVSHHWQRYLDYAEAREVVNAQCEEYRWLIEEFRVSLFAQELKTAVPVSAKRLQAQWKEV